MSLDGGPSTPRGGGGRPPPQVLADIPVAAAAQAAPGLAAADVARLRQAELQMQAADRLQEETQARARGFQGFGVLLGFCWVGGGGADAGGGPAPGTAAYVSAPAPRPTNNPLSRNKHERALYRAPPSPQPPNNRKPLETKPQNAKNALESHLYALRDRLTDGLAPGLPERDRGDAAARLDALEAWLYEDGEDAAKGVYVQKLQVGGSIPCGAGWRRRVVCFERGVVSDLRGCLACAPLSTRWLVLRAATWRASEGLAVLPAPAAL
jgi:hypothetical protein